MGKRSTFPRRDRDYYATPEKAVLPLIPHLPTTVTSYWEPCAGDGALIRALAKHWRWGTCSKATDVEPTYVTIDSANALETTTVAPMIITNPPWTREILHPMIHHFANQAPTWLLFDADWMHTKQAAEFMPFCLKTVSVGRLKWIEDSKHSGKDNVAWYLFDKSVPLPGSETESNTLFFGRLHDV